MTVRLNDKDKGPGLGGQDGRGIRCGYHQVGADVSPKIRDADVGLTYECNGKTAGCWYSPDQGVLRGATATTTPDQDNS